MSTLNTAKCQDALLFIYQFDPAMLSLINVAMSS